MIASRSRLFVALLVVVGFGVASHVQAQTVVTAKIPFAFSLRGESFPSGVYSFVAMGSGESRTVQLWNAVSGKGRFVNAEAQDAASSIPTAIKFQRYGSHLVLSDISVSGIGMTLHVAPTRAEREMASRETADVVTVLASR